ncbi:metallophosphoesterase [Nonomuraea thailandensis]
MFVLIFVALVLLAHWYLWHRLVRRTTRPGRLRRVLTWSLVALLAVLVTTFVGTRMGLESWVAWPGYIWLALMFYLVIILVVLEVPRAVATAFLRRAERRDRTPEPEPEPVAVPVGAAPPVEAAPPAPPSSPESPALSRRLFLGRTTAAIAGVSALGTVGYGMSSALGDPVIERVSVTLPRLDPRLSGLRFAVVSDIHLGPLTGLGHTERIVRMINGLEADVVAIVGDLVDGSVAQLGRWRGRCGVSSPATGPIS